MRRVVVWVIVCALCGLLGFILAGGLHLERRTLKNSPELYQALTRASGLKITDVHCEINGPGMLKNGAHVYPETRVGDFIAGYLYWSENVRSRGFGGRVSCAGGDPVRKCSWSFGDIETSEGWGRTLNFEYDTKAGAVVPSSLQCIDVP